MAIAPPHDGILDAHMHVWDLSLGEYSWLGPQHGALYDTFTAEAARAALDEAGTSAAVLVQAEDSERDTEFMLAAADRNPWITGVVGWVPVDDVAAAERLLDRWQRHPAFCGVRQLLHDDPRTGLLASPEVRDTLALLAERSVPFDVPDAWPRLLVEAEELATALPELTIVIDHLAKPPRGRPDYDQWLRALRAIAGHPNVVAKVSGLQTSGAPLTVEALEPVWDAALDLFGPDRLMYGGDWPMTVPYGGYRPNWSVLSELIGRLPDSRQAKILAGTARAVYGLGDR